MNTLIVLGLALLTLALFARSVFYLPRSTEPERQVVALLEAKHLASGYGNYWGSAIITVYTQGKFSVRQVMPSGNTLTLPRLKHGGFSVLPRNYRCESPKGLPCERYSNIGHSML